MKGLQDKVAIVTGGAGRIGIGVVRRLVQEGVRVAVADINEEAAIRVAAEHGERAIAIAFDAASEESIKRLVECTAGHFGRLDILHNNAAYVALGRLHEDTTAQEVPVDLWDTTMSVNVRGYMLATKYALPFMIANGGGSIINTSSGSGMTGDYVRIAYGTSKGAVIAMTRYIAAQHGRQGIRCNSIAPGMIVDEGLRKAAPKMVALNERHTLLNRVGRPEDIGALVAFLASDDSAFITGQIICCDGGTLAHVPQMVEAMEMDAEYS